MDVTNNLADKLPAIVQQLLTGVGVDLASLEDHEAAAITQFASAMQAAESAIVTQALGGIEDIMHPVLDEIRQANETLKRMADFLDRVSVAPPKL